MESDSREQKQGVGSGIGKVGKPIQVCFTRLVTAVDS